MTTISNAGRLGLLALLVAEVAACGGGGGGGSPPPPPPPPPAATVQSFTPADAAAQIDVQSTLAIAFDKSLDPASVTRAHVTLFSQGVPVATKVTYDDATHSVHVDPMGLGYGRSYTLAVSGLVDANGKTVAGRQAVFSTWANPETSGIYLRYAYSPTPTPTPAVYQAQIDTFDATGAMTGYYLSNNPGPDGAWNTPDDVIFGGYAKLTYTSDGQFAMSVSYGAGSDGLWHTADDQATPGEKRTFLPNGALATDDRFLVSTPFGSSVPEAFTTYTYGADGALKMATFATDKGPDGLWGTADDVLTWRISYDYDDFGRLVLEQTYGAGPSGILGTPDDVRIEHTQHFYLANGRVDHVDDYYQADYNAPDSTLGEVDQYSYDADNNNVKIVVGDSYGPYSYTLNAFDAHNNRLSHQYFDAAGADGLWFTGDDRLAISRTYDNTK